MRNDVEPSCFGRAANGVSEGRFDSVARRPQSRNLTSPGGGPIQLCRTAAECLIAGDVCPELPKPGQPSPVLPAAAHAGSTSELLRGAHCGARRPRRIELAAPRDKADPVAVDALHRGVWIPAAPLHGDAAGCADERSRRGTASRLWFPSLARPFRSTVLISARVSASGGVLTHQRRTPAALVGAGSARDAGASVGRESRRTRRRVAAAVGVLRSDAPLCVADVHAAPAVGSVLGHHGARTTSASAVPLPSLEPVQPTMDRPKMTPARCNPRDERGASTSRPSSRRAWRCARWSPRNKPGRQRSLFASVVEASLAPESVGAASPSAASPGPESPASFVPASKGQTIEHRE
jgi:hypothetical protein